MYPGLIDDYIVNLNQINNSFLALNVYIFYKFIVVTCKKRAQSNISI